MEIWKWVFIAILFLADLVVKIEPFKLGHSQHTERISGSAGDVLEDDPVGRLKVFVYELPSKYNKKILQKDPRCLTTCLQLRYTCVGFFYLALFEPSTLRMLIGFTLLYTLHVT